MNLDFYKNSSNTFVKERAKKLEQYIEAVDQKKLTSSEFEELYQDLFDLEKIDQLADTVDEKVLLDKAFRALLQIASTIPLPK